MIHPYWPYAIHMDCGVDFTINHIVTECQKYEYIVYGYENQTPHT